MPKNKKTYPNCIWMVPPESHGFNFCSALLIKPIGGLPHIFSEFVSLRSHIQLSSTMSIARSNLQIRFGSKALRMPYELLCHQSFHSPDPLLDELLAYLPLFSSHIFNFIVYENSDDDHQYLESKKIGFLLQRFNLFLLTFP